MSHQSPPVLSPQVSFRYPNVGERIRNTGNNRIYTIGAYIGGGNFSQVFCATDNWERELAVKVLKPQGTYEQVKLAAIGEASSLVLLRHTRITYVYDIFEYEGAFYIVSERCGQPVATLLSLGDNERRAFVRPLAQHLLDALDYMHSHAYVHQDVHLHNVFLAWTKSALGTDQALSFKLGDLGLAKPVESINVDNTLLADWMLPPEYLDRSFGPMDRRVDIYHASLLMLQVLIGKSLNLTREDILIGVPRTTAENLSDPYGSVLALGLRRHVEARPSTALQFWEAIRAIAP